MTASRTTGAVAALVTFLAALLAVLVVTGVTPLAADAGDTGAAAPAAPVTGLPAGTATDGSASADRAGTAAPAAPRAGQVTVDLVGTQPAVARPGGTVTLTVRITNGRETPLEGGHVDLGVHWRPLTSRDDLAAWARDGDTSTTVARQLSEDVATIPPGESRRMDVELDVDILDLSADAPWGPREMSLSVVDGSEATLDVLHTFLLFAPRGSAPADAVGLSVLAPVTGPPAPSDAASGPAYADDLTDLTADDGRLTALADAGTPSGSSPGITLAADPAVVAAAQGSEDAATADWATRLTDGSVAEVATLPAYDPDLGALAHADLTAGEISAATGASLPQWQTPETWGPDLAWPQGRPDLETMSAGRDSGVEHVVVSSGLAAPDDVPASARTAATTTSGKVSALVADDHLSDVVASLTTGDAAPTAAEATQRLLADTALLAVEQAAAGGKDPLRVLATAPRGWTPDATALHEALGALDDAGWADVVPLSETIDTPATETSRATLPAVDPDTDELSPASVRRLAEAHRSVRSYASVAEDPAALTADVTQALAAPLSVAYRDTPEARDDAVAAALEQAAALQQGISVADRTAVTLISDNAEIPVVVRNDLPTDATVTVVLHPDDPRLKIESRPTVVVPAGKSTNVPVEVRAIGSGNVTIRVEALAPSGATVAEPTTFDVRVRAGWETVGTAVVASAIGLLFLAGIWRSVRRARARRAAPETPESSTSPTSPDQPAKDGPV